MIKFTAKTGDGRLLIGFGLSEKNRELMAKGHPCFIEGGDINQPNLVFIIFASNDEASMMEELRKLGVQLPPGPHIRHGEVN